MENYRSEHILSSSKNTYSVNGITLGQSVSNFFRVAKNILSNKIDYESKHQTVSNMKCISVKSDKTILEIDGKFVPCHLCVEFNGINNDYYLEPCQGTKISLKESNDVYTIGEPEIFKNILMV